jgi:pimeloyl-[acyl-carrier protein] methyl ester esterase
MRVALLHGWAFDAALWDAVRPLLGELDCVADERGYLGATPRGAAAEVVVGHSLGVLRALLDPPEGMRALVAINGFDCFAARDGLPAGVAPRVLDRMRARLGSDAAAVVGEFCARCGAPDAPALADAARLAADLSLLRHGDGRGAWRGPLVLLDGAADPILTEAHRAACFADRTDAQRETVTDGGHLLPLTHPERCAMTIRSAVGVLA